MDEFQPMFLDKKKQNLSSQIYDKKKPHILKEKKVFIKLHNAYHTVFWE